MIVDEQAFLIALTGVSATLIGAFLVGVFFYMDSEQHRKLTASLAADLYLRAGVRWIFVAFAVPVFVSLALVSMEGLVAAVVFIIFSLMLLVSTIDTGRCIVAARGFGTSWGLRLNHVFSSVAVVVIVSLPWIIGGWVPAPEAYIPSLLLALGAGFSSTVALVMEQFDATMGMSPPADRPRSDIDA